MLDTFYPITVPVHIPPVPNPYDAEAVVCRPDVEQGKVAMQTLVPPIFVAINEAVDSAYGAGRGPLVDALLALKLVIARQSDSTQPSE